MVEFRKMVEFVMFPLIKDDGMFVGIFVSRLFNGMVDVKLGIEEG